VYTVLAKEKDDMAVKKEEMEFTEKNIYSFPNPSAGETTIRFTVSASMEVNVIINDTNNRAVWQKTLRRTEVKKGINHIQWNGLNDAGKEAANGIYLCKVSAEGRVITKKIAVIR
jgi:flagellar hook assembly protein FlgD